MAVTRDRWKRIPFISGVPIPFEGAFSREEFDKIREGMVPEVMEDKWFAYFEKPHLFLHRSWTGHPVYRVVRKWRWWLGDRGALRCRGDREHWRRLSS